MCDRFGLARLLSLGLLLTAVLAAGGVVAPNIASGLRRTVDRGAAGPASLRRIASGQFPTARLSANGEWVLVTEQSTVPFGGKLYLWRRGYRRLHPVGRGGFGLAVSSGGSHIAYSCDWLRLCIKDVRSRRAAQEIAVPCVIESAGVPGFVADDFRSVLVGCVLPHATFLLHVGGHRTTVTTVSESTDLARFFFEPLGLSSNGSIALLDNPVAEGAPIYVYRAGVLRQIAGVTYFAGTSRNERFVIANGPKSVPVTCGNACTRSVPIPVVLDLQTGGMREFPAFVCDTPRLVSNDGRTLVVVTHPCEASHSRGSVLHREGSCRSNSFAAV
jgi:hypothetical protein